MDSIVLLFGNNGAGKTRFLKNKLKEYVLDNKHVISNLNTKNRITVDEHKVNLMNNGIKPYGLYGSNEWNNYNTDEMLNKILTYILSEGDVLILDEIDSILPYQDVINICNIIKEVSDLWDFIFLTGHTDDMLVVCKDLNFYYMEDNNIKELKASDVDAYIDKI